MYDTFKFKVDTDDGSDDAEKAANGAESAAKEAESTANGAESAANGAPVLKEAEVPPTLLHAVDAKYSPQPGT
jgi:hypothetical protein